MTLRTIRKETKGEKEYLVQIDDETKKIVITRNHLSVASPLPATFTAMENTETCVLTISKEGFISWCECTICYNIEFGLT